MANFTALKVSIQNAIKQNGNEEITGNLLQQILLSIVNTMGDSAINTIEQNLSSETLARQNADNLLQNAINAINANINNGYVYAGIATPSSIPLTGKVFYIAIGAGIYTHFGNVTVTKGINILRKNGSVWIVEKLIGIDDEPTKDSGNLVTSGGVAERYGYFVQNPTFVKLLTDELLTIIAGVFPDGRVFVEKLISEYVEFSKKIDTPVSSISFIENDGWEKIMQDYFGNIISGITKDGHFFQAKSYNTDNAKINNIWRRLTDIDGLNKIISPFNINHLSSFNREEEFNGYRMQGMAFDYINKKFFLAGNKLGGLPYETQICMTSDLINLSDAVFIYGNYGHANDITFNENTNRIYVAGGTGASGYYCNKIYVFDATNLAYIEEIEISEFNDVLNISYISGSNSYIIGDYERANLYNGDFELVSQNIMRLGEGVIDAYYDIPGSKTAAQGIAEYEGMIYKVYAASLRSNVFDSGILGCLDMKGRGLIKTRLLNAPNLFGNEFEAAVFDPLKRKMYFAWDGDMISFSECYIDYSVSELPRTIIANENLNHILGYGRYVAQNHSIAATIINYPDDIMQGYVESEGVYQEGTEYHGFSIEVMPASYGSLVQIFRSFKKYAMDEGEDIPHVEFTPVTAKRMCIKDGSSFVWTNWELCNN